MLIRALHVLGSGLLGAFVLCAVTACAVLAERRGSASERALDFHRPDRLRQGALEVISRLEGTVPLEITDRMRTDAAKAMVRFTSDEVWFYEAGGWRLYFDTNLNLKRIQYYHPAASAANGVNVIAEVDNRQVAWLFDGITRGRGLVPRIAATADRYVVNDVTVWTLALGIDGREMVRQTALIPRPRQSTISDEASPP